MMHPGIVGALALIGTAGAIYFGSGYLNDYFAVRNADRAAETAVQSADAANTPSNLVTDMGDAAAESAETDTMTDMVQDSAETASEEIAALADDAGEVVADMADTVEETAQETLERVLEAAPRPETETSEQDAAPETGTTPVLDIVRIEPTGEAVIAGNAPQGERVGLLYNNELIADTQVDAGGDFVLVPNEPIPSGEGTMEVVIIDEAGNMVAPSQEQVAVVLPENGSDDGFLVGVLRPNEPVDIIEREAPEVAVLVEPTRSTETSSPESTTTEAAETTQAAVEAPEVEVAARVEPNQPVETEQAATPEAFVIVDAIELEGDDMWIAGGALPGTVIRLYQDNVFLGEVITGDEGRYLFEGTLLDSQGEVTVRADALVTGSADVIARTEVPFEVPLSSADIATAALEQVEDAVAAVEETTTEVVETAQEQVADTVETASDASADIAETVQEQAETAIEVASEVADAVADTAAEAIEAVQEGAATAVQTASEVAETAIGAVPEEVASATDTAVETAEAVTAEVAQAVDTQVPQVETAAATTTEATPGTPPTEALAEALTQNAADTSSEQQAPAVEIAATEASAEPDPATPDSTTPPAAAPATQPERVSVLNTGQVIIRRGDNLWRLSRRVYGQGIRYTSIYDANRDQIGQPELIFPGQVFTLPTPQEEWGQVPGLEALEPDQVPSGNQ